MSAEDLEQLRQMKFMPSRIPALDALEVFVPNDSPHDDELAELQSRTGQSRWYPVEGGHRVLILYEGGSYNTQRFKLLSGAWDHEHCSHCGVSIPPMTLCWVTEEGPYVLLDEGCYQQAFGSGPAA
jgi:hypothetical protein